MERYILNKNKQDSKNGNNYEVHNLNKICTHLPKLENQIDLGWHQNCWQALEKAKTKYPNNAHEIDGCFYCTECHAE